MATHELVLLGKVEERRPLLHISDARALLDIVIDIRLVETSGAPPIRLQLEIHLPLLATAHLRPLKVCVRP